VDAANRQRLQRPYLDDFQASHRPRRGVRKGEKGSLTVYANKITRTEIDRKTGEENPTEIHYMKGYTVFNVEQIDGLPAHYYGKPVPQLEPLPRIERAETFFAATGADVRHGGDRAYYAISSDHIQMPPFEAFRDAESYYATLAHEGTHYAEVRIMPCPV
jgi:antirestriction protein ArdC